MSFRLSNRSALRRFGYIWKRNCFCSSTKTNTALECLVIICSDHTNPPQLLSTPRTPMLWIISGPHRISRFNQLTFREKIKDNRFPQRICSLLFPSSPCISGSHVCLLFWLLTLSFWNMHISAPHWRVIRDWRTDAGPRPPSTARIIEADDFSIAGALEDLGVDVSQIPALKSFAAIETRSTDKAQCSCCKCKSGISSKTDQELNNC